MKTTIMLQEKAGYNLPLANSIKLMRRQLRGDLAGDAYVIAHYGARGTRTILKEGYLVSGEETPSNLDIVNSTNNLKTFLDSESEDARFKYCCTPANYFKKESLTMAMLFMKCKDDGVIGIAWLDNNGSSRKALLMCGFLGYELGMINHDKDNILWTAGTQYLLDDPKLIRDIKDVKRVLQLALIEEIHRHDKIEIITEAE